MNNLKKAGLSALAGSLAMVSAHAGDFTVTGGSEITYVSNNTVSGNPFGMSHNIKFTGSGEVNGIGWTVFSDTAGQDFATDSSALTFDFGDMGTLAFEQGADSSGIGSLANNTPTAYEEADHQTGSLADGLDAGGDTGVFAYNNTLAGLGISVEYNPSTGGTALTQAGGNSGDGSTGSNVNYALTYAVGDLALAFGQSNNNNSGDTNDDSEITYSANYAIGDFKVGVQRSDIDAGLATSADNEVTAYAVAYNINEDLSVSYGISDNTKDNKAGVADVTEENTGISAAYSMGSASVRATYNQTDNVGGVSGTNNDAMELSLNLTF